MGKKITKLLLLLLFLTFCGCHNSKTPKEFACHPKPDKAIYKNDSLLIDILFKKMLLENIDPFDLPLIYDKKSILSVDTILYSPDFAKVVALAIVKNALSKFDRYSLDTSKYTYEGHYFYGYRNSEQKLIMNKGSWYRFSSDTKNDVKEYFNTYAFIRKSTGHLYEGEPPYNMDDIRFWKSKEVAWYIKDSVNLVMLKDNKLVSLKKE